MISSIDRQADISIFLNNDERDKLKTQTLEGVLIRLEKPKRQGKIYLSVNESRKMENGSFGIGINDKKYWGIDKFEVEVFLGEQWYKDILENPAIGTRTRMLDGAKIQFYRAENSMTAEYLEFYRDNKDKLREELG